MLNKNNIKNTNITETPLKIQILPLFYIQIFSHF